MMIRMNRITLAAVIILSIVPTFGGDAMADEDSRFTVWYIPMNMASVKPVSREDIVQYASFIIHVNDLTFFFDRLENEINPEGAPVCNDSIDARIKILDTIDSDNPTYYIGSLRCFYNDLEYIGQLTNKLSDDLEIFLLKEIGEETLGTGYTYYLEKLQERY